MQMSEGNCERVVYHLGQTIDQPVFPQQPTTLVCLPFKKKKYGQFRLSCSDKAILVFPPGINSDRNIRTENCVQTGSRLSLN